MSYAARMGQTAVQIVTTDVIPANRYRKRVTFIASTPNIIISLYKGGGAQVGKGIQLHYQGSYEDAPDNKGYIYTGSYSAIADVGVGYLSWCEE